MTGRFLVGSLVVLICAPLVAAADKTADTDWPQWRGPRRDGITHETNLRALWSEDGPKKLWERDVGTGLASVSIRSGRLYTMGNGGGKDTIWCLDAETGDVIWKRTYPSKGGTARFPGAHIAPTVDGDRLYALSTEGQIFCLHAETGDVIWSKDAVKQLGAKVGGHGFACHPIVDGNKVIIELGARGGAIVAFNKVNGEVIWRGGGFKTGYSSPVIYQRGGTRELVIFAGSGVVGMNVENGKELWRFPTRIQHDNSVTTPVIAGDKVFMSSAYYSKGSILLRIVGKRPEVIWESREMRNHCGSSVLWKGYLYGFDGRVDRSVGRGGLKCLDFRTGELKWTEKSFEIGSLILVDGKLIILSRSGELGVAEASPQRFKLLSRAKVLNGRCWNMPVLTRGRVYCRNLEGRLVCLDVRKHEKPGTASHEKESGVVRSGLLPQEQTD